MPHATCYKLQATATVDTDGAAAAAVQQSLSGFHTACPGCDRSGRPCIRPRVGELWPNNLGYPRLTRVCLVLTLKLGGGEVTAKERTRVRVREKWRPMSHFSWEPSNAEVVEKQMGEERKPAEAFRVGFLSRSHWLPHLQPEVCTGRTPQASLFAFCRVL
ncbi:hypothetical protein BO79DRAFT_233678 [Aspergillus costaricaensis CBS 115574]|uniref:Uncharacterized protein n=1 Tax=Aspergillus costaricaensis CBS 115574 TaxID=1448317 RepID=A0ACD1HY34_9EURO|nr:hypothetical protein BO79DRAFT_233678 [Aspergillus costaricaensis CBS 115574]RAK83073.1 hypothetical protein BO79DRAFT_233678 [Aspergillus costaricaensis CBS 115574]